MTRYEALPELTRERMEGIWAQQQRPTPTVAESSKAVREIVFPLLDHLEGAVSRADALEATLKAVKASGVLSMRPDLQDVVLDALATAGGQ
jgi:hypothetical protein